MIGFARPIYRKNDALSLREIIVLQKKVDSLETVIREYENNQ